MVSLVRSGPRIIMLKSSNHEALREFLMREFNALNYDLYTAFEHAKEDSTIIYIADDLKESVPLEEVRDTFLVTEEPDMLLSKLFTSANRDLIEDVRPAPHILLVRAIGDMESVILQMQKDVGGEISTFRDIIDHGNDKTTLVALTEKPLNRNLAISDFYTKFLRLEGRHFEYLKDLRMHSLKYLNTGIGNRDWHEIEIRIFDRYSAYKLHYDRLIEMFEGLELGLVLGESWSKDYPRFMMSVEVYRIRFFTFKEPKTIKWLLLGMEYLADGTRIVDYDVYYNHKKIDWLDTLRPNDPRTRHLAGLKAREEVFSRLSSDAIEALEQLELDVIKTRD